MRGHKVSLPVFNGLVTAGTTSVFNLRRGNHVTPKGSTSFIFVRPGDDCILAGSSLRCHRGIDPCINHAVNTHVAGAVLHNSIVCSVRRNFPITPGNRFVLGRRRWSNPYGTHPYNKRSPIGIYLYSVLRSTTGTYCRSFDNFSLFFTAQL